MSLKKIAEELGLSLTTVSRALNGYPEVAQATRTAFMATAALAGVGAVHAALQAGCVLGQDVSLIVYDGLGTDSVICQAITSIDPPPPSLVGAVLAELLVARLRGEAPETLQRLRMPVLVVGDSDGPSQG